jgi:nonribosomal peptide synthetase DhbF
MKADLGQRVDFLRSPLWTSALLKAAPDLFFWYHRTHHILMDGFSGPLFARRVADVYGAIVNGLSPGVSPFGSLASLLEDDAVYRASERFARDRHYWLECMADRPDLVTVSGRPFAVSSRYLRQTAHLRSTSACALRTVVQRVGVSLPQFIIAAAGAYAHRLTGAQDLVLGFPVTGRSGALSRRIPGMASNVVPLRLSVQPSMSPAELMQQADAESSKHCGTNVTVWKTCVGILVFWAAIRDCSVW